MYYWTLIGASIENVDLMSLKSSSMIGCSKNDLDFDAIIRGI